MADQNCAVIEGLERDWCTALCTRDIDRLQSLVHKDFVLIGTRSTGPFMMTRDDWFEAIQRREVDAIDVDVRDATLAKDVMIGTVHARWRLKYLGRTIEDCVVLTDVWVNEDGRWQVIRRHSTPAPPGACPDLKGN